jgi:predicted enzyme related to lactoylglutathione lyase
LQPDVKEALDFYRALFGWEFDVPGAIPGGSPGEYFVARLAGRAVAGIGSLADGDGPLEPSWITHVRVDDVDEAAEKAKEAGGTVLHGPLDAFPAGRLAVVADPAGARFCVWEANAREGAQLINEPCAWDISSLRTTDIEGSKAFYASMFGWQPEPFGGPDSPISLWRLPGYIGGQPQQPAPRDSVAVMTPVGGPGSAGKEYAHWSVDFYCDDADAIADTTARMGGRVIVAPYDNPGFRNAVLADPQGATFSVSQQTGDADSD